jgi:hypothetical protein
MLGVQEAEETFPPQVQERSTAAEVDGWDTDPDVDADLDTDADSGVESESESEHDGVNHEQDHDHDHEQDDDAPGRRDYGRTFEDGVWR